MSQSKRRLLRLYVERDLGGDTLSLDEREAHYLAHVLRLQRGAELIVFNGRGTEREASIAAVQRRGAELALGAQVAAVTASPLELTIVQALPKADAMDLIVQKATELGVRTLVPVYSDFSVVRLDAERAERRVEHWQRIARSACEQCGRHEPPLIRRPDALGAALAELPSAASRLALDPGGAAGIGAVKRPAEAVIAIGPEGGFSDADWRRLDAAGFTRVSLGPRILRAETAAFAVAAIAQALWGDYAAAPCQ
jgi:16S rRNA (uracil1498-N3)-methyltransferase